MGLCWQTCYWREHVKKLDASIEVETSRDKEIQQISKILEMLHPLEACTEIEEH